MKQVIDHVLMQSIRFYDSAKAFYHGLMLGLFQGWEDYNIKSNRESGMGRSDLIFYPENVEAPAIIMELKQVQKKRKSFLHVRMRCSRLRITGMTMSLSMMGMRLLNMGSVSVGSRVYWR